MKNTKQSKMRFVTVLILSLGLVLVGCGGGGSMVPEAGRQGSTPSCLWSKIVSPEVISFRNNKVREIREYGVNETDFSTLRLFNYNSSSIEETVFEVKNGDKTHIKKITTDMDAKGRILRKIERFKSGGTEETIFSDFDSCGNPQKHILRKFDPPQTHYEFYSDIEYEICGDYCVAIVFCDEKCSVTNRMMKWFDPESYRTTKTYMPSPHASEYSETAFYHYESDAGRLVKIEYELSGGKKGNKIFFYDSKNRIIKIEMHKMLKRSVGVSKQEFFY